MGQDGENGAGDARRRRDATLAKVDASVATLDPVWVERFESDVASDKANEDGILLKAWLIGSVVLFLVLMQRLFS